MHCAQSMQPSGRTHQNAAAPCPSLSPQAPCSPGSLSSAVAACTTSLAAVALRLCCRQKPSAASSDHASRVPATASANLAAKARRAPDCMQSADPAGTDRAGGTGGAQEVQHVASARARVCVCQCVWGGGKLESMRTKSCASLLQWYAHARQQQRNAVTSGLTPCLQPGRHVGAEDKRVVQRPVAV